MITTRSRGAGALVLAALVLLSWVATRNPLHFVANVALTYFAVWGLVLLLSPLPSREVAFRAVLVTLSGCVGLVVFEIPAMLRLVDYRIAFRTPILSPARNPLYETDPELVFIRRPNESLVGSTFGDIAHVFYVPDAPEHPYDLRYDSNGFRNASDLESVGIALIGDSFVESTLVADGELASAVLAELQGTQVANLGQIQYGPQQELAVLRRFALPLEPETVIWIFFEGNDLGDVRLYEVMMANLEDFVGSRHSLMHRSFTKNSLQFLMRVVGEPKPSAIPRSALLGSAAGEQRIYFMYPGKPLAPQDHEALEILEASLMNARDLTRSAGVRLLVAFAPSKYRVLQPLLDVEPSTDVFGWTLNELPDRVRAQVEALEGVAFLDLTEPLRRGAESGDLPFLPDDSHWSPSGNRIVAMALSAALDSIAAEANNREEG